MLRVAEIMQKQRELDERIIVEHGLFEVYEDQVLNDADRLMNTTSALLVELHEWFNDTRTFKVWSKDRNPKTTALEEYVDALHFFMSLANQLELSPMDMVVQPSDFDFMAGYWLDMIKEGMTEEEVAERERYFVNDMFQAMVVSVGTLGGMINEKETAIELLMNAYTIFYALGHIHFEYLDEKINEMYFRKNQINHTRQDEHY